MKAVSTCCLALLLGVAVTAEEGAKKPEPLDPAKLVGDWTYVSGVKAGEKLPADHLAGKVTFTKDTVLVPAGKDMKFVMAYKIDPKASPATIDLDIKDGPVKEGKAAGIIALEGDELKLCYAVAPGKRPEKFESTKDNGAMYFVLKRAK
jgi:uncharacterized protein (TIGR03067 family)